MCTNGQKSRMQRSTLSIRRERRGATRLVGVTLAMRMRIWKVNTEILQTKDRTPRQDESSHFFHSTRTRFEAVTRLNLWAQKKKPGWTAEQTEQSNNRSAVGERVSRLSSVSVAQTPMSTLPHRRNRSTADAVPFSF